jgi:hypothetical protein
VSTTEDVKEEADDLDSAPPSPVLKAMATVQSDKDHALSSSTKVSKPFQEDVGGVAFTPTLQGKGGFSISKTVSSPNVVPMVPNAMGYQFEPLYNALPPPQIARYRPSSPVMDDDESGPGIPDIPGIPGIQPLSLPPALPRSYRPSSPSMDSPTEEKSTDLNVDQITSILDSLAQMGSISTEPAPQPSKQDMSSLLSGLQSHIIHGRGNENVHF